MAQSIQQIRSDIESTKENISQTLGEIEERFQEIKDFKSIVQRYPFISFAVSVGVGILLSGNTGPFVAKYKKQYDPYDYRNNIRVYFTTTE